MGEGMTEKLVATFENRRSGARVIKFQGVLDEDNGLASLVERVGSGIALINLAGIERINSIGTRDWIKWLATLEARGTRPMFIACSPAVVHQLSRIKNFAGNGTIKSFQVPYLCAPCEREQLVLVHVADLGPLPYQLPVHSCDACGGEMEIIDDAGAYYAFLNELRHTRTEKKSEPPEMARGSRGSIAPDQIMRISQPRLPSRDSSRPSLSAFQQLAERHSERELIKPAMAPPNERPYLIAIVLLLLCTVGVLAFLLLT
jgi:anti-anti-sigma regulatory factor